MGDAPDNPEFYVGLDIDPAATDPSDLGLEGAYAMTSNAMPGAHGLIPNQFRPICGLIPIVWDESENHAEDLADIDLAANNPVELPLEIETETGAYNYTSLGNSSDSYTSWCSKCCLQSKMLEWCSHCNRYLLDGASSDGFSPSRDSGWQRDTIPGSCGLIPNHADDLAHIDLAAANPVEMPLLEIVAVKAGAALAGARD